MSEEREEKTVCPKFGSDKWSCWDERTHWYRVTVADKESHQEVGDLFEFPVGYMKCLDCGNAYLDIQQFDGAEYVGDDRDAGMDADYLGDWSGWL